MKRSPTLCCIPVSWPTGLGELARLLTLAEAAGQRWPDARFHFILNRAVPEVARAWVPESYGLTLLDTSPTKDDEAVIAALDGCRPDLVFFDNAGSWRQCHHAKRSGASTVFLSTREDKRAKGLHPSWLPWLDEHWIVGPTAIEACLSRWQRINVSLSRTVVRSFQSIFAPSVAERRTATRRAVGCNGIPYVCFVPGGGGGTVDGVSAVSIFADAAAIVAQRAGIVCVLLEGPLHQGSVAAHPGLIVYRASHAETVDLMEDAHLVVLGASSSLFQALAQRKVCVATTAGGSEQLARARAWAARGVIEAAEPRVDCLATAACAVLDNSARWHALRRHVTSLGVTNDLPKALSAVRELLDPYASGMG